VAKRPVYLQIADDLREGIVKGTYPPGSRLPSRARLAQKYEVSDRVAFEAVRLLTTEGLAETQPGSGSFVRRKPKARRLTRNWYREARQGSPFDADMLAQGHKGKWSAKTEVLEPSPVVAERLGLKAGERTVQTSYEHFIDEEPVMLATSWEPHILVEGNGVILPERGLRANIGIIERMASIGIHLTRVVESISARPALKTEIEKLHDQRGLSLVVIERTYFAGDRPVETADLVMPSDRYQVWYEMPIGDD
jgi:DNA-binding GntR family transcriptional regulator